MGTQAQAQTEISVDCLTLYKLFDERSRYNVHTCAVGRVNTVLKTYCNTRHAEIRKYDKNYTLIIISLVLMGFPVVSLLRILQK